MRTLTPTVLVASVLLVSFYASAQSEPRGLPARVAELEAQVEALEMALSQANEILQFVRVETGEMNSLSGPHWIVEGANVHVQSGSGRTDDGCESSDPDFPTCESLTGPGNLVVGYKQQRVSRSERANRPREIRTGSHNLVVGDFHTYSSFAGFVAGSNNEVTGPNCVG